MKAKDVYAVWKKHKAILTVPPGFGKMPVAEQVKILNKAARSKQAGMAGFVKDYNELKQQSKTSGPAVKGGKGGKGGVDTTGKKIGLKPKPPEPEPVRLDFNLYKGSIVKIVKDRRMVDPQIAIQKEKRQARDLRKRAEKQAANILNITLDNVIAKVEENEERAKIDRQKKMIQDEKDKLALPENRKKRFDEIHKLRNDAQDNLERHAKTLAKIEAKSKALGSNRPWISDPRKHNLYERKISLDTWIIKQQDINIERRIWDYNATGSAWELDRWKKRKSYKNDLETEPDWIKDESQMIRRNFYSSGGWIGDHNAEIQRKNWSRSPYNPRNKLPKAE
tara:strand:+ start:16747 stop:17754 length:1008 start_codon:yes stop_codon:yes gene_type:complete